MSQKNTDNSTSVLYSMISISIVLFLLGAYGILFLHANNLSNLIKEKINIIVELEDNASKEATGKIMDLLSSYDGIIDESVRYIPKSEALDIMSSYFSNIPTAGTENPFKNVIVFNIDAASFSDGFIEKVRQEITGNEGVLDIYTENETVNLVKENVQKLSYISLIVGGIFIILSLVIIYNTVKLKLHADRMEIKTMQLVGAKRGFIARPYLKEALSIATKAFLLASVFLVLCMILLLINFPGLADIIYWFYIGIVFLSMFLISIFLTVGVARMVVKSYLNAQRTELV